MIRAVIDTNVLVSALRTSNPESPTVRIYNAIVARKIIPLHSPEIIDEYNDVLYRAKFSFQRERVAAVIEFIKACGAEIAPAESEENFPDPDDRVFFCVTLAVDGAHLVTGNIKHFPAAPFVVTPREFCDLAGI